MTDPQEFQISQEVIHTFMDKFQVPAFAAPFLSYIFTKQEILFVASIKKAVFSIGDIQLTLADLQNTYAQKSHQTFSPMPVSKDAADFQTSAYRRGILSYIDDSLQSMKLADFYERMDIMAISEQTQYREIPAEGRKSITNWAFEEYYTHLNPDFTRRPTVDEILPLDEVISFIRAKKDLPVYLNYCDCKSLNGECGKPTDTCVTYKDGINTYAHRGHAKKIDAATAIAVVQRADKAGLVHTVNPTGICNCCNDCCYLFRSQAKRGSTGFWPKTTHIVTYDETKCVQCGLCIKRCMFQVFKKREKTLAVDSGRCIGCGLCVNTCPKDALALITRS